jgi:hypothetical protein
MEMNINANGRETVALFKCESVMSKIANNPPKMRNERIIREFMICLIRSTSIRDYTAPSTETQPISGQTTCLFILFKKVVHYSLHG